MPILAGVVTSRQFRGSDTPRAGVQYHNGARQRRHPDNPQPLASIEPPLNPSVAAAIPLPQLVETDISLIGLYPQFTLFSDVHHVELRYIDER